MKLTKKLEAEILKAYHALWDANLRGDIKTFASFLDNNITVYGTAAGEIFRTKKEAVKFYKVTADQMAGKADFRKRKIRIKSIGDTVVINEQCDLYVLVETKWIFYGHARITTIYEQKGNSWKVVHMHGSFPDSRTGEGEQLNTDKVKAENLLLRNAVKRRTIELEEKNRELEIETALEKVRSVAMGMKEAADMPGICKTIAEQLEILGIEAIRNVQTAVFKRPTTIYTNYEYFPLNDKSIITEVDYMLQPDVKAFAKRMLKASGTFYTRSFDRKELKEWSQYQKKENQYRDPRQQTANSLHYYFFSIENAALGISIFTELNKEEINVFKKFRNVFELAYKRFIDIQKAEAQAREAQIEAALERVRARTMAMHKSSELLDVVKILGEQFELLGFKFDSVNFNTDYSEKDFNLWLYNSGSAMYPGKIHIPYIDHPCFNRVHEVFQNGADFGSFIFTKKEKDSFFDHIYANSVAKYGSEERKKYTYAAPAMAMSVAVSKNTSVTVTNYEGRPFSEDENAILRRFANVFDQTYTRFLDLQKAEAQGREAQIEAALEKIRSRSLAMHQSKELKDVIAVLFEKLSELDVLLGTVAIQLFDVDSMDSYLWVGNRIQDPQMVYMPHDKKMMQADGYVKDGWIAMREGEDIINKEYSFAQKNKFFKYVFANNDLTQIPEAAREVLRKMRKHIVCLFTDKNSALFVDSFNGQFFSEDSLAIIKRAGKVFEQCYIRFLDLQKAEAQAREAQIEAALERVRARTMGMHQSAELHDVIDTMTTQLLGLQLKFDNSCFCRINKDKSWELWLSTPQQSYPTLIHLPYIDHEIFNRLYEGLEFFEDVYDQKEAIVFFRHFFENSIARNVPEERKQLVYKSKGITRAGFLVRDIWFVIVRYDLQSFNDEEKEIIKRFAKVFEQSYTRFLDLQNAEAQAREAQIEAALERVRSRAMAMQNSEELKALIGTVFAELTKLDLALTRCAIWIFDKETNAGKWWMANSEDPGNPGVYYLKYHEHPPYLAFLTEWKKQTQKFVYDLHGQIKKEWDNFLFSETELAHLPIYVQEGMRAPDRVLLSASFNNFGAVNVASLEPLSGEHFDILLRFAKVFDLTYTRFNDLKQAEAQARESQIQLALERVRARSMAMQKSSELSDTAFVLFQQFKELGAKAEQFSIGIINEEEEVGEMYATIQGDQLLQKRTISIHEPIAFKKAYTAWKEKKQNLVLEIKGKELETYNIYRNKIIGRKIFSEEIKAGAQWNILCSFFSNGILSFASSESVPEEILRLLERFAKVFDGTYTRFLDLQKAETQAREAKIEAALERVRARSMGMQKSDELAEVVAVLYKQFEELDFGLYQVLVSIYDRKNNIIEWWSRGMSEKKELPQRNIIPIIDHPFSNDLFEKWTNGIEYYPHILEGDPKRSWEEYLFTQTDLKNFPQEVKDAMRGFDKVYLSDVFMKYGSLQAAGPAPLPDDKADILKRFVKVLDLAYTRMMDLQNAEAQGREAKIQLALERVRARTMAMQRSDELLGVVSTLYEQLNSLQFDSNACNIIIIDKESNNQRYWVSGFTQKLYPESYNVPYFKHPYIDDQLQSWKEGRNYIVIEYSGKMKQEFDKQFFLQTDFKNVPEEVQKIISALPSAKLSTAFFTYGALQIIGPHPLSEENATILQRFAKVFDQTYTRFLDLQKAEAQARESQIQLALERVRARTMAMQKSDELSETAAVLFKQFQDLGEDLMQMTIGVMNEDERVFDFNVTDWGGSGLQVDRSFKLSIDEPSLISKFYQAWKDKMPSIVVDLTGKELEDWIRYRNETSGITVSSLDTLGRRVIIAATFSKGVIAYSSPIPRPEESRRLLERFAGVFDLTYTRFLDLKNAEAQAREAKIEAALERVRSRAMAMHSSQELKDVALELRNQMGQMAQRELEVCAIHLYDESPDHFEAWAAIRPPADEGNIIQLQATFPKQGVRIVDEMMQAYRSGKKDYILVNEGEKIIEWLEQLKQQVPEGYKIVLESLNGVAPQDFRTYWSMADFQGGSLVMTTYIPPNEEARSLLRRFANVFGLAYRRFVDLKQAEAQAHEARIEIALERIRARALAMHKSDELIEVAKVLWEQMTLLGQRELEASAVHLYEVDPDNVHSWRAVSIGPDANPGLTYGHMAIPKNSCEVVREWLSNFQSDLTEYTLELSGAKQDEWYDLLFKLAPNVANSMRQKDDMHEKRYYRFSKFSGGALLMISKQEPSEEVNYLQRRAAVVFDLAYRRFSDLQKAEAQAREAQIEAALERVRSKAMAMHKSEDLNSAVATVFEELQKLNLGVMRCGIPVFNKEKRTGDVWTTSLSDLGSTIQLSFNDESFDIHPLLHGAFEAWLKQEDFSYTLQGDDLTQYYQALREVDFKLPSSQTVLSNAELKQQFYHIATFQAGGLFAFSETPFPDEAKKIMKRFAGVFNLTYKRFLDLQKAEAQAREAQIEASLERVRSKTMAMHNSNDVGETVATMFAEFVNLGIRTNRCGILIFNDEATAEVWTARSNSEGKATLIIGRLDLGVHNLLMSVHEAWKRKESFHRYDLLSDEIRAYYEAINKSEYYPVKFDLNRLPAKEFHSDFFFPEGAVFAFTKEPIADEHQKIFKRFAGVFGQTYRRYLDLQKAEAQAREAQIEAALERVRAKAMAMHKSEDLQAAVTIMFEEFRKLNLDVLRCGIGILNKDSKIGTVWATSVSDSGLAVQISANESFDTHPLMRQIYEHWQRQEDLVYMLEGEDLIDYYKAMDASQLKLPKSQLLFSADSFRVQYYYGAMFNAGGLYAFRDEPFGAEDIKIMKRFASVVDLTYKRFFDLQKAEAQAREATIEAALEKVRGKAMAMHNSNDLSVTTSLIIGELRKLGIKPIRCGVGIISKETHKAHLYTATSSADGDSLSVVGWVLLKGHPVLENIYEKFVAGQDYFPELTGDSMRSYYEQLLAGLSVPLPDFNAAQKHYGHFFAVSVGCLYTWSDTRYNDDEIKILKRFATIIDLTFRRYFELQKSEANAREAVKQAALDRVRADIASMRSISDLDRITPLIWNELTILGLPFIRCGVFIMDDSQQQIHTFLSTPDGKAIAAFHLPYDTPGNISKVIDNWRLKKQYVDHWDEEEFIQFAEILIKQGALTSREQYLKAIPHGGFHLHFLPFLQGMLYVGNTVQLNEEQIELIQHVADAFSTAYARYEDFNRLEAAKQQVENTLTDLKQAQTQLVQSEKMASLGELTAGIAHEIQNPLNFVNNFSDVSNELLEEMKQELATGNTQQAMDIVNDVIDNLEKILHHGKRADAIVKGMLQHSRTSSGQKEMTDINILADEYLRLAYHGLRAKDKSFNAKFETHFDNNIGKVNVIPQDIGRVILNLINNAFYTVTEKKKKNDNARPPARAGTDGDDLVGRGYEPIVTVTTLKDNGRIEIKVKDNGNGIPQKNLDKIFQPFFTTKPTGQGTGLGLSLAYDIVKTHGGELKVKTIEGEGSEFIIQFPAS